jgi:hypothetical protein
MKSLPLQMQHNLILAATLLGGVIFAPNKHYLAPSYSLELKRAVGGAFEAESYGTAVSFSKRPEVSRQTEAPAMSSTPVAGVTADGSQALAASQKPIDGTKFTGRVPDAVRGYWSWSSSDSAGDIASSQFTFRSNGHYSYTYTVRQSMRGRVVDSTTIEEGSVVFENNGTFVMFPEQGRYHGNTGDGLVNRSMDQAELGTRTFYWSWRTEDGRKRLFLGPTEKSAAAFTLAGAV